MRHAVVLVLVSLSSMAGLAIPLIGLFGYIVFGLMRPDTFSYIGPNKYSFVLAVCTLIGSGRKLQNVVNVLQDPFSRGFLLLQLPIGLSTLFAVDMDLSLVKYVPFLQMSLMALLIPVLVETAGHLRLLTLAMGFSLGFLGLKFGLYGILAGGAHFVQGVEGFHAENNTLALGLATALPLSWQGIYLCRKLWSKLIFAGLVFGSIAAIVMTQSRSGILSLGVALLLTIWSSKYRVRTLVVLGILALPAPLLVWDAFKTRMSTLSDPLQEASAYSRYDLNMAALKVIRDHPILGAGFGAENAARLSLKYKSFNLDRTQVVHNNYLQWAADSGIPALLIYCGLLFAAIVWLSGCASRFKETVPDFAYSATGLKVSLVTFAVGSTFTSRTNYDFIYMLLLSAGCLYRLVHEHERATALAAQGAPLTEPAGPAAPALPDPPLPPRPAPLPRPTGLGRALRAAGRNLPLR